MVSNRENSKWANAHATKNRRARENLHIIAHCGAVTMAVVAQSDQMQAVEILAYVLGIEIGGIVVLEVAPGTNVATPNVESALGWQ